MPPTNPLRQGHTASTPSPTSRLTTLPIRSPLQRVAVVGGGWAGLAAAVRVAHEGHHVTVFEASRSWGGRARSVTVQPADGPPLVLDNGQHILIGAYTDTLRLMEMVGVDTRSAFVRLPLRLTYPDGQGLALPDWPAPLDVLAGVIGAQGWSWRDKWALLRTALGWQRSGFSCLPHTTVDALCAGLPERLREEFIDPLCVSALNTPANRASGEVFLRVLKDALFGAPKGSNLLLPCEPMGALWPEAAARWLQQRPASADLRLGTRVTSLEPAPGGPPPHPHLDHEPAAGTLPPAHTWRVNGEIFDRVVWAVSASKQAFDLIDKAQSASFSEANNSHPSAHLWSDAGQRMDFEAIATVYAWAHAQRANRPTKTLAHPMLALRHTTAHPAQFVFDRGQLNGPPGLLAFVVSASDSDSATLTAAVTQQARVQLGQHIQVIQTIVEKRATFACTPGLQRPAMHIAPGLVAAGDHVQGPYPATLEGAMRSGWAAGATPF